MPIVKVQLLDDDGVPYFAAKADTNLFINARGNTYHLWSTVDEAEGVARSYSLVDSDELPMGDIFEESLEFVLGSRS
jgi:hypothetical protein